MGTRKIPVFPLCHARYEWCTVVCRIPAACGRSGPVALPWLRNVREAGMMAPRYCCPPAASPMRLYYPSPQSLILYKLFIYTLVECLPGWGEKVLQMLKMGKGRRSSPAIISSSPFGSNRPLKAVFVLVLLKYRLKD